jgi:hypothetical protein
MREKKEKKERSSSKITLKDTSGMGNRFGNREDSLVHPTDDTRSEGQGRRSEKKRK